MHSHHKQAKTFLLNATKSEYNYIVEEAFLTKRQKRILLMKVNDGELDNWKIANTLNVSVDTVNHELMKIYEKISRVLW